MAVININELKARFAAGDRPSERDFIDLIDTLLAGAGAHPSGPAGGDLAGDYPNPAIGDGKVTIDKIQDINTNRLLGRYTSGTGHPEEITVGAGLTFSGTALVSTAAAAAGTTPNVSGSVITFTSDDEPMPASEGVVTITADAAFGNVLPQVVRVVAVCIAGHANWDAGDEVPIELFRIYGSDEIPAIRTSVALAGGLIQVRLILRYASFGATSGISVYDKDAATPTLVGFANVGDLQGKFTLRVYMSRQESGTGFGSISQFEDIQAVPAAAAVTDFAHNFGAQPSLPVRVTLKCASSESGGTEHAVGDEIPIESAFETGFANPAFGVTVNNDHVLVRREATTIVVPKKTDGSLTTLTAAKWNLKVTAHRTVNVPTLIFPATSFKFGFPNAAFCYGEKLYVWHSNPYHSYTTWLSRVNLTNGLVTLVHDYGVSLAYINPSLFRFNNSGDPVDCIVFSSSGGIRRLRLRDEVQDTIYSPGTFHDNIVADFKESGGSATYANPNMLLVAQKYSDAAAFNTTNHVASLLVWSGSAYALGAPSYINWALLSGVAGAGYSINFQPYHQYGSITALFQYNPVSKRIYMITSIGCLFIFKFNGTLPGGTSLYNWWDTTPDGTQLDFEKTIVLGGIAGYTSDGLIIKFFVEFDTVTGTEKSITIVNRFNTHWGSVTRIPWVE